MTTTKEAIFIAGLQRSGTTLLGRLMAAHPDITGLIGTPTREDEGQFVQDVYLSDHQMGTINGHVRGRTFRWVYHPEAHLTEDDLADRPDAAARLVTAWGPYFEKPGAPYFVEKSPSNLTRARFLQAAFPSARFVVVTRNPVVQALATRKWLPRHMQVGIGLDPVVAHWVKAMETFAADEAALNKVMVIRYEHLLANPDDVMDGVWRFLGVRKVPLAPGSVRDENARYLRYWAAMEQGLGALGKLEPLNPPTRRLSAIPRTLERTVVPFVGKRTTTSVKRKFAEPVASFGYSLSDLSMTTQWPLPLTAANGVV
ncbi:sulfotransferase [Microbacterium sp. HD4P20]|uniref:sulfotransferase family protein n=1 Tax=Microbacterium sp. HD4P20 TaxID=2864874 RepID=UPI001C6425CC|nr:sulfotransferase [Microbacterium sp. HD4P20]MCP2638105.1 sulfotransferase [Microbacterium sp. HD4P20]